MYSDNPQMIKDYAEHAGLWLDVAQRTRDNFFPKDLLTEAGVLQTSLNPLMPLRPEACGFAAISLMRFAVIQPSKLMTRVRFPSPAPLPAQVHAFEMLERDQIVPI